MNRRKRYKEVSCNLHYTILIWNQHFFVFLCFFLCRIWNHFFKMRTYFSSPRTLSEYSWKKTALIFRTCYLANNPIVGSRFTRQWEHNDCLISCCTRSLSPLLTMPYKFAFNSTPRYYFALLQQTVYCLNFVAMNSESGFTFIQS